MKAFLDENFLLTNKISEQLYHEFSKDLPIIDYHNHLPPQDIATNRKFNNITQAWLEGDHYKWRAMRANGIDESFVTGSASDEEKFVKWAETVPYTLRNPLYHWTHLELQRYFGIKDLLAPNTAKSIYEKTQTLFTQDDFSCVGLLKSRKVESLCTTDDPIDDLKYHQQIAKNKPGVKVYPTFRPDKALLLDHPNAFVEYLSQLSVVTNTSIVSLDSLLSALQNRVDYFHENGCRLSDYGLSTLPILHSEQNLEANFKSLLNGSVVSAEAKESLQAYILIELCKMYHAKSWTQQFHIGALRNNNERALRELGPDTGYDSIGDYNHAISLSKLFNTLDNTDQLAKTIIYNLNPKDNQLFATMIGNFNDGKTIGKIQYGSGWWFLDQKRGMINQLDTLSNMGLLSRFVGMLTDSRSFLSFPRHEYFRRILCELIGKDVVNGELPNDIQLLGKMVQDISYYNAKNYFDFN